MSVSLPGWTGQSSNPLTSKVAKVAGYWMPAFAGMTPFVDGRDKPGHDEAY